MGLIDIIKSILTFNKKPARIIVEDLSKTSGESTPLEIGLYSESTPLTDKTLNIKINNVNYIRTTNENGIAKLNINLPIGEYDTHITFDDPDYHYTRSFCEVTVNPIVECNDLTMSEKDGSKYTATVKNGNGTLLGGVKVLFTVNGRNYERITGDNGVASLNINLPVGNYKVLTKVYKVLKENMIHITSPVPVNVNHYGYWVFGGDMKKVNLESMKACNVTDLFLNYYAVTTHGEEAVKEWINKANGLGLHVHLWMQCFYDGEWHNPASTDLTDKINEAKYYADIHGVYGVHLDYLRYPGNAYKTEGATEAVNRFARQVREAVGDKFLSCAIMPESENEYYYGQDAGALGRICDVVIPMQYKGNYGAGSSWLASTTKMFSQMASIWSGLQSYRSDDDPSVLTESELQNDINTCIDNGAKGAILFRYGLSPEVHFPSTPSPTDKKTTKIEGTDINMTYRDGTQYQCAVYDDNGRVAGTVNLTINGKTYPKTPDNTGLYKLNLNLPVGNYTINANYLGDNTHLPSSVTNSITINEPKPEPTQLWDYFTQQGGGYLGQKNSVNCGPHSLMQCIHRLTGEDVSEMTLASVCGTTSEGTDHEGLATGLAWFNREYGYNLKMEWKNFSEVGFEGTQELIDNGACFHHINYRNRYGHYEVPKWTNGDPIYVLNSLGDDCGNGYCGYIEERSRATHQSYINGISQKSVCIITR